MKLKLEIGKSYNNRRGETARIDKFIDGWFWGEITSGERKGGAGAYKEDGKWSDYESCHDLISEVRNILPETFTVATPNSRIHQIVQKRFFEQNVFWISKCRNVLDNPVATHVVYTNGKFHANFVIHGELISLTDFLVKDIVPKIKIGNVEISRDDVLRLLDLAKGFTKYNLPPKFYVETADEELCQIVRRKIKSLLPVEFVQGVFGGAVTYENGKLASVRPEEAAGWHRVYIETLFSPKLRKPGKTEAGGHQVEFMNEMIKIGEVPISVEELKKLV